MENKTIRSQSWWKPVKSSFPKLVCLSVSVLDWASGCKQQLQLCDYEPFALLCVHTENPVCVCARQWLWWHLVTVSFIKFNSTFLTLYRNFPPHNSDTTRGFLNMDDICFYHWPQLEERIKNLYFKEAANLWAAGGLQEIYFTETLFVVDNIWWIFHLLETPWGSIQTLPWPMAEWRRKLLKTMI